MNLILETTNLSYIKELQEDSNQKKIKKTKKTKVKKDIPDGINGIKTDTNEVSEDAGLVAAAVTPSAIIGWQHIRHKIGF